jgi:hypothetical protein
MDMTDHRGSSLLCHLSGTYREKGHASPTRKRDGADIEVQYVRCETCHKIVEKNTYAVV